MRHFRSVLALIFLLGGANAALGQGAEVALGGLAHDTSLPVEVSADSLAVDQQDGSAIFSGNVVVGQGEMRLAAAEIRVEYGEDTSEITRLLATGGVIFSNGDTEARADSAELTIAAGLIEMQGNIVLNQGANILSAERMTIDLDNGRARLDGSVRTIIAPGDQ